MKPETVPCEICKKDSVFVVADYYAADYVAGVARSLWVHSHHYFCKEHRRGPYEYDKNGNFVKEVKLG